MFNSLKDALVDASEIATEHFAKGGVEFVGMPTGIRTLDYMTGGLRKQEVYIIAGRSGLGKSSVALNLAKTQSDAGHRVGYISLEMSAQVLAFRWLASELKLSSMKIERGKISREDLTRIQNAKDRVNKNLMIDDSMYSSRDVKKALEVLDPPLDVLYVDYLTLLRDAASENNAERIAEMSANLKDVAKQFNIPVVVLAQLNRETEKRETHRPTLSDIRGSGAPEQDAGGVFLLHRPHYYKLMNGTGEKVSVEKDAEIIVAKNRFGPMGAVEMWFYPSEMRWIGKEQ